MREQWQLWQSSLTVEQCKDIHTICKQYPEQDAGIFDSNVEVSTIRRSKIRWIQNNPFIKDLLTYYGKEANRNVFNFDLVDAYDFQFTEYNSNEQGFYDWHHDIHWESDRMYDRKLSVVIQLTDPTEYSGGDFEFKSVKKPEFKPQGSVLVFPSYLEHKVTPVTEGTRYSLVTWIEGPRWR